MKIKAAIARTAKGEFVVEEVELAEPRPDELLVRLVATGVCHTDLAVLDGIIPLPLPYVLGHEAAGHIHRVGENVTGFVVGDPVVLTFNSCGHCTNCTHHHPAYCDAYTPLNFAGRRLDGSATIIDGAGEPVRAAFFGQSSFATFALASARNTIKVRPDAPLELLGPLACGFSTGAGTVFNVLKPGPATTFAVVGTGAVGMAAIMAAKVNGVARIIAVDRVASRLNLARELGATETIDTNERDLIAAFGEVGGLDAAIDTSGVPSLIAATVGALKGTGTCILLGASGQTELKLSILPLIRGATVRGALHGDCDPADLIPRLIDLFMAGRFPIDRLSAFYTLGEINQAKDDSTSGKTIKPILRLMTGAAEQGTGMASPSPGADHAG